MKSINTITYDDVRSVFYFADTEHPLIYELKFTDARSFVINDFAATQDKRIKDLVYDFHDDTLYWSTYGSKKISKMSVKRKDGAIETKETTFLESESDVAGLEIDTCNRKLYFTTSDSLINVVPLNNPEKVTPFGHGKHETPVAISLDHQNRRLYVADRLDTSYSVDSYSSAGSDFRQETKNQNKSPRSIAVDKDMVYFIEARYGYLMGFLKNGTDLKTVEAKLLINNDPTDIIVRRNFITDHSAKNCNVSQSRMADVQIEKENTSTPKASVIVQKIVKNCLHGGNLDAKSSSCICNENFDGEFCEINLCYQYCLNDGECAMQKDLQTQKSTPHCSCKRDYEGDRCEIDRCNNYCLNDGKCNVNARREPNCQCKSEFIGKRCETSKPKPRDDQIVTTTVQTTTTAATESNSTLGPPALVKTVDDAQLPLSCHNETSNEQRTFVYMIVIGIIVLALITAITIVSLMMWRGKSLRIPKPHKRYIFSKKIDNTTYRPTTEQCEVIIEDCCNMNICETVSWLCCTV